MARGGSTIARFKWTSGAAFFGVFLNAKDIRPETQIGAVDRPEIGGIEGAVAELPGSSAIDRFYAREIGENFA